MCKELGNPGRELFEQYTNGQIDENGYFEKVAQLVRETPRESAESRSSASGAEANAATSKKSRR
ncbi:MAG TPA: hypothetical protein VFI02_18210 [Armatimonadota bacterium]|nr:hypothetical protein [Armatimonadota bacterium]